MWVILNAEFYLNYQFSIKGQFFTLPSKRSNIDLWYIVQFLIHDTKVNF
jgi:hypothetical protein